MPAPTTAIFLNSTTPAAPSGDQNVKPQSDGATPQQSISFYPQVATASLRGTVKPDGTTITIAGDGTISAAGGGGGGVPWLKITNPASLSMTWLNQGSATETVGSASRTIYDPGSGSPGYRCRIKAASAPPFSVTAAIGAAGLVLSGTAAGVVNAIFASDGTKLVIFYLYTNAGLAFYVDYTTPTAFASGPIGPVDLYSETSGPLYLKIYDDGTDLNFLFSQDGENFLTVGALPRLAYLSAVSYFGYACQGNPAGQPSNVMLYSWTEGTS